MGNHAEYYKEALRYLGCMKMEDIPGNNKGLTTTCPFSAINPRYLQFHGLILVYGVQHHFQQYFSYIVVVSFIDGGNQPC
jgi:hypothetical protein